MSNAEDLLNSLSDSDIALYTVDPETEPHIVIDSDRNITVPDELQRIAVQYDHNVETVTFDCPRYWDGLDMSEMTVYINYLRSDKEKGAFIATNVVVDDDDPTIMHFDWTISRNVTEAYGKLVFLVCIKKADDESNEENHWNSELCSICTVSEGLELDEDVLYEIYPDIIEAWHREVLGIIDDVETVKDNLIEMRDNGDFIGPQGNPGVSPVVTVTDIEGGHRVTIEDVNGTQYFDVMDAIVDSTEAVTALLDEYVWVGNVEPTSGPKLWFDTSDTTTTDTASVVMLTTDGTDGEVSAEVDNTTYVLDNTEVASTPSSTTMYCFDIE